MFWEYLTFFEVLLFSLDALPYQLSISDNERFKKQTLETQVKCSNVGIERLFIRPFQA
jgi:hypothetical protein